jgi:hypothetical protein
MPWYQFCESAFGFAFSDLLLIICGWVDFCTTHGVVETDKVWVSDTLFRCTTKPGEVKYLFEISEIVKFDIKGVWTT